MPWHMSLDLNAKVRRTSSQNEWLLQTLDIVNMDVHVFGFIVILIYEINLLKNLQSP